MNKILSTFIFLIFSLIIFQACQDAPEKEIKTMKAAIKRPINPNGDSELALLMRKMFADVERIKKQVQKGETVTVKIDHEKILSAHATEPEKAASAEFKAWGATYLKGIEALINSSPGNVEQHYSSLINSCMSCHKAFCPGPIKRIKKLNLPS